MPHTLHRLLQIKYPVLALLHHIYLPFSLFMMHFYFFRTIFSFRQLFSKAAHTYRDTFSCEEKKYSRCLRPDGAFAASFPSRPLELFTSSLSSQDIHADTLIAPGTAFYTSNSLLLLFVLLPFSCSCCMDR